MFSKGIGRWSLVARHDSLNVAYCHAASVSASKEILICQANYVGSEREVDTSLYAVDFTRDPVDSRFFDLRDTVGTAGPCRSWASVRSATFAVGSLRLLVEYGRNEETAEGSASSDSGKIAAQRHHSRPKFPHRLYEVTFKILGDGVTLAEHSIKNIDFVTARWETASCTTGQGSGKDR